MAGARGFQRSLPPGRGGVEARGKGGQGLLAWKGGRAGRLLEVAARAPMLFMVMKKCYLLWLGWALGVASLWGATAGELEAVNAETLRPYVGESVAGVDVGTLTGKVMAGYQGWFNAEGDGAGRGFHHWTKGAGGLEDGNAKIDLWPEVAELGADERFPTGFRHADGRVAEVYSAFRGATVERHFKWMQDYGIDGVFVQRFAGPLREAVPLRHNNVVLDHCRAGANRYGRAYAVMYDLSGLGPHAMEGVMEDWRALRRQMQVTEDRAYLKHRGRPVVVVWGVGFLKDRAYTLGECRSLIEFLKKDGCTVMLGVPSGWRKLEKDSAADPALHEVLQLADVVSPWTVGRYGTPGEAAAHGEEVWKPDLAWCRARGLDYMPVAFPGFSWYNMKGKAFDKIPRLKGDFMWSQFVAARGAGAEMLYVAMFDEVDEGTAIFKCSNDLPVGVASRFLGYEGLPSDFYLKLTARGARYLRGEVSGR